VAVVNGYITVPELKDWVALNDTVDDIKIERAITAASRAIDNHCERRFWQFTGARLFDTCDQWILDIDDLVSVTTLKTDAAGDGTYETTWAVGDYQLLPLNPAAAPELRPYDKILAVAGQTFPSPTGRGRVGLVEITGVWGWPAIPEAVSQACKLIATRLLKRKESPEGVSGFDEFGVIRISTRDDPDAVRLLNPYWNPSSVGV